MEQMPTAEECRNAARYCQEVARNLVASSAGFPADRVEQVNRPTLQVSPTLRQEDQSAVLGFADLRESLNRAASMLSALAAALESGRQLPPVFWVPVQPYLEAFRADPEAVRLAQEEAAAAPQPAKRTPTARKGRRSRS
jgi:hypothetical protein